MNLLAKLPLLSLLLCALFLVSDVDAKKNKRCARKSSLAPATSTSSWSSSSSSSSHSTTPSSSQIASSQSHKVATTKTHQSFIAHGSSASDTPKSTSSSSSAAAATSSSPSGNNQSLIPNGVKAGVAGGQSLKWVASHLGWYYDWTPSPNNSNADNIQRIPMLWGLGKTSDPNDKSRFEEFKKLPKPAAKYVAGFNEPDFAGSGSSGYIDPQAAASAWDEYIAPHGHAGAKLISPSCAKQSDETWMKPFLTAVKTQPDIIAVHIFANNTGLVKKDLDHYAQYGKPMMVTEFACIDYQGATKYCDQDLTSSLISQAVQIFESDDRVVGYALSDAYNGPNSALTTANSGARLASLTSTGKVYMSLVSKYKSSKRHLARAVHGVQSHAHFLRRRQIRV